MIQQHYDVTSLVLSQEPATTEDMPRHFAQLHSLAHGETRELTIQGMAIANGINKIKEAQKSSAHQDKFSEGDLVLIQDFQLRKHHRQKLNPRWIRPRVLVQVNLGRRTALI